MENTKKILDNQVVLSLLGTVVCEKSDLIWTLTFDRELHELVVQELFLQFPLCEN